MKKIFIFEHALNKKTNFEKIFGSNREMLYFLADKKIATKAGKTLGSDQAANVAISLAGSALVNAKESSKTTKRKIEKKLLNKKK